VAVSPIVRGGVLKPATVPFMRWAGQPLNSDGIAGFYAGVIDGLVADEPTAAVPIHEVDVMMGDSEGRRRLAEATLDFATSLAR
jgi:hypothetical protein